LNILLGLSREALTPGHIDGVLFLVVEVGDQDKDSIAFGDWHDWFEMMEDVDEREGSCCYSEFWTTSIVLLYSFFTAVVLFVHEVCNAYKVCVYSGDNIAPC
jgi:hypothetical protein